jgi:hypothetical protein
VPTHAQYDRLVTSHTKTQSHDVRLSVVEGKHDY